MQIFKQIVFSLLGVLLVVLTVATIIEKLYGTAVVSELIYSSVWFVVLWAVFGILSVVYLFLHKLQKQPITLLLHLAFLVILIGAFTTWLFGKQGVVHVREGKTTSIFYNKDGELETFPFELVLTKFKVTYYPGTDAPMDFMSYLLVRTSDDTLEKMEVSMNKIGDCQGYRFYQSGYDPDGLGASLTVSYDPYGIAVTYTGYLLLLITMIVFFFQKNSQFRQLLKNPLLKKTFLLCLVLGSSLGVSAQNTNPQVLPKDVASHFGDLYVYYNGRICPLQTLAQDFTVKMYGKSTYKGFSSEQVLTGWIFFSDSWEDEPFIKIKSKNVRKLLHVDQKYASFHNFITPENQYKLAEVKANMMAGKGQYDAKGIEAADEKFNLIVSLYAGSMLKLFPYRSDSTALLQWYTATDNLPGNMENDKWIFIRRAMDYVSELVLTKDYEHTHILLDKLIKYQQKEAALLLPTAQKMQAEKCYNRFNNAFPLAVVSLVIGVFLFLLFMRYEIVQKEVNRLFKVSLTGLMVLAFGYLTLLIVLRAYVSGHVPLSNGFETMQFLAWSVMLTTIVGQNKFAMALPFGFLLSGLTLMVAFMGQSNPQITPLMPVLSSPLLSLHVVVIMLAYALLAFMMMNGVTALVLYGSTKTSSVEIERLALISRILLYPAVFLLTIGIFIGAVWANVSWGRYWGWDPKEVWALITLLIYALGLHSKSLSLFRNPLHFHIFTVLSFLSVLITYFGVNFILGGMHSYAG